MARVDLDLGSPAQTKRVVDALCAGGNYAGDDAGRAAFARGVIAEFVATTVRNVEVARRPPVVIPEPDPVVIL